MYTIQAERRQKFFLVLPVLVLPFVVLLFWTLGWVGTAHGQQGHHTAGLGVNLSLPAAGPARDSNWNKMRYYEQADKDSAKLRSYLKNDPYRRSELDKQGLLTQATTSDGEPISSVATQAGSSSKLLFDPYSTANATASEAKLYRQLEALNRELARSEDVQAKATSTQPALPAKAAEPVNPELARLEAMLQAVPGGQGESDNKELAQLNQMLDKIMLIQHPEKVLNDEQDQSMKKKRQVFSVKPPTEEMVSTLQNSGADRWKKLLADAASDSTPRAWQAALASNRFYSLEEPESLSAITHTIPAVVAADQTLVSGGMVKLSLLESVYIAGQQIPAGQWVYGRASLNGERLSIAISSIVYHQQILPVDLTVYDTDGMAGIHIQGAITRDVAKRSAAQSVQSINAIGSLDPSLGAQVASAGVQAAQSLIGKSARLVRVHLNTDYRVLLKDDNNKEN